MEEENISKKNLNVDRISPKVLSLLLLVFVVSVFFLFSKNDQETSQPEPLPEVRKLGIEEFSEISPGEIGVWYPFITKSSQINTDVLFFYNAETKESHETDFQAVEVFPSPNNFYSIVRVSGGLGTGWGGDGEPEKFFLIKNNYPDLAPVLISNLGEIDEWSSPLSQFIEWSPDSQKALFLKFRDDESTDGYPSYYDYYLYDISTLEMNKLNNLSGVFTSAPGNIPSGINFIDSNRLLVRGYRTEGQRLYTYTISSDIFLNHTDIPLIEKNVEEVKFIQPGDKWLVFKRDWVSQPHTASLILTDFPKTDGVMIDSGEGIYMQSDFFLSPNGDYISYQRQFYKDSSGLSKTWLYDVRNGTKKEVSAGDPVGWISDKTFLVKDYYPYEIRYAIGVDGTKFSLQSDFYNEYSLEKNDKGFVYLVDGFGFGNFHVRFFDILGKSKTMIIPDYVRFKNHIRYDSGKVYYIKDENNELQSTDLYTREFKSTGHKIDRDFLVADSKLFNVVCSGGYDRNTEYNCSLQLINLASGSLVKSWVIENRLELHPDQEQWFNPYLESYDADTNSIRMSQSWDNGCCYSYDTTFDFDLDDGIYHDLYSLYCSGDEHSTCEVSEGKEIYNKLNHYYCAGLNVDYIDTDKDGISENLKVTGLKQKSQDIVLGYSQYLGCIE